MKNAPCGPPALWGGEESVELPGGVQAVPVLLFLALGLQWASQQPSTARAQSALVTAPHAPGTSMHAGHHAGQSCWGNATLRGKIYCSPPPVRQAHKGAERQPRIEGVGLPAPHLQDQCHRGQGRGTPLHSEQL